MFRLTDRAEWYLFDPKDVPLLLSSYGDDFSDAYDTYVNSVVPIAVVQAVDLWIAICDAQRESGGPFLLYQDNANRMSPPSMHDSPC